MDNQVDRNIAKRVADAAATFAEVASTITGRKVINQITKAIHRLPGFFDRIPANRQYAYLPILETESAETAEKAFNRLALNRQGSERFAVDIRAVGFMTPTERLFKAAEAARAKVPNTYVVMAEEIIPHHHPESVFTLRLTSRQLTSPPRISEE